MVDTISIDGSTALQPLIQSTADDYMGSCLGAHITVNGGGSQAGLSDVEDGRAYIGDSDVFALSEQSDLVDHQVTVVIYVVVVNSDTGIANLSTQQIRDIYRGKYTNWREVGGNNLLIRTISRKDSSSGTRQTFDKYVLGGLPENPASQLPASNDAVAAAVQQTPGAIGYVSLYEAQSHQIIQVSIDGNSARKELVINNTYHFWNIEHMYTKGQATGLAQTFINYMGNEQVRKELEAKSFVNISDIPLEVLNTRCP